MIVLEHSGNHITIYHNILNITMVINEVIIKSQLYHNGTGNYYSIIEVTAIPQTVLMITRK